MFKTPEYQHLLKAERAIALALDPRPTHDGKSFVSADAREVAQLAVALTRVVDQKRIMRGQPAPRPAEVERKLGKERRQSRPASPDGPTDPADLAK